MAADVHPSHPVVASPSPFAAALLLGIGEPRAESAAIAERLITVREAAEVLRVRPVTVYKLCASGALPHVRVSNAIRITPRTLAAFVRERGT